jgi:hypothetical protein
VYSNYYCCIIHYINPLLWIDHVGNCKRPNPLLRIGQNIIVIGRIRSQPQNILKRPQNILKVVITTQIEKSALPVKRHLHVRKIGPWSSKIKQMWKKNKEDNQYNRDTDLHGSPSVGYIHQRNCQVLPLLLSNILRDTTYRKPAVTSSSFSHSRLSQNTIFIINHSHNVFPI